MRYTADLEIAFEADGDEAAGPVLISLVRLLNGLALAEDQGVESYLLSRGDVRIEVDVKTSEFMGKPRRAELHILPQIRTLQNDSTVSGGANE